jgi:hypothetical protein
MAPPCYPAGTLVHTTTTSPSFITSPGNVILPLFPTKTNKPNPVPRVTATKKASKKTPIKKATTKINNFKKKSSSISNSSAKTKIPPRSPSQTSLTQMLSNMHEKAAASKPRSDLEMSEMQKFMKEEE